MRASGVSAIVFFVLGAVAGCDEIATSPAVGELRPACVDADSDPAHAVDFVRDIRPLMNGDVAGTKGCKSCHYESVGTHEGLIATGLNLEKLQTLRLGGRETPPGSIIVSGKPCSSALVKKLEGTFAGGRMPKNGPYWSPAEIQIVADWIAEGAPGGDE